MLGLRRDSPPLEAVELPLELEPEPELVVLPEPALDPPRGVALLPVDDPLDVGLRLS